MDVSPEKKQKCSRKTSSKAKSDDVEKEFMGNMNRCLHFVESVVKDKQGKPPSSKVNIDWALLLARILVRLDEMKTEDMQYEIDGMMIRAYIEMKQRGSEKE